MPYLFFHHSGQSHLDEPTEDNEVLLRNRHVQPCRCLMALHSGWRRQNGNGTGRTVGFSFLETAHIYFYVYLVAINPGHSTVPGAE